MKGMMGKGRRNDGEMEKRQYAKIEEWSMRRARQKEECAHEGND